MNYRKKWAISPNGFKLIMQNAPTTADVLKANVSKAVSNTQPKITEKH
jgi:hypothetical protein